MDVAEPGRGLAPGLSVAILRALSGRSTSVTAAHLTRLAGRGTEAGVRRAVERLADHGVCTREEIAGRTAYSLNEDHVLYRAVSELLRADGELGRRLTKTFGGWSPAPVAAVLYGSAARRDGGLDSDIDLLLVRPPLRTTTERRAWAEQIHTVRMDVARWTGNDLHVLDRSVAELRRLARDEELLLGDINADGFTVHGPTLAALVEGVA
jgi:DNA-binding transcriptional ArsR family regulator